MLNLMFKKGDKIGWVHDRRYNTGIVARFLPGGHVLIATITRHNGSTMEVRVHEFNKPRLHCANFGSRNC